MKGTPSIDVTIFKCQDSTNPPVRTDTVSSVESQAMGMNKTCSLRQHTPGHLSCQTCGMCLDNPHVLHFFVCFWGQFHYDSNSWAQAILLSQFLNYLGLQILLAKPHVLNTTHSINENRLLFFWHVYVCVVCVHLCMGVQVHRVQMHGWIHMHVEARGLLEKIFLNHAGFLDDSRFCQVNSEH